MAKWKQVEALFPNPLPFPQPQNGDQVADNLAACQPQLVEALRYLLKRAEQGRLISLAVGFTEANQPLEIVGPQSKTNCRQYCFGTQSDVRHSVAHQIDAFGDKGNPFMQMAAQMMDGGAEVVHVDGPDPEQNAPGSSEIH